MLWSMGLPRANTAPSWARLGPILGHLGRCSVFRSLPGRHLEADSGLGGIDSEFTCGKKATCQQLQKTIEKQRLFDDLPGQEGHESMPTRLFGGLVVVLTVFLQVWGAM